MASLSETPLPPSTLELTKISSALNDPIENYTDTGTINTTASITPPTTTTTNECTDISPNQNKTIMKTIVKPSKLTQTHTQTHKPQKGDECKIFYTGFLFDDEECVFDEQKTYPFKFILGGGLIEGWNIAIPTMTLGEISRLDIDAIYAYGDAGSAPEIAPGARISFEVELVAINGLTVDVAENGGGNDSSDANDLVEFDPIAERLRLLKITREEQRVEKEVKKQLVEERQAAAKEKLKKGGDKKGKEGKGIGGRKEKEKKSKK